MGVLLLVIERLFHREQLLRESLTIGFNIYQLAINYLGVLRFAIGNLAHSVSAEFFKVH